MVLRRRDSPRRVQLYVASGFSPKFEHVQFWRVSHAVSYFKGWSKCTAGSPSGSATPGL